MQELIAQLKDQANLSEEQAAQAAQVMKEFLHTRLPEPLRAPVEAALTGERIQDAAQQARSMLGGLLGDK